MRSPRALTRAAAGAPLPLKVCGPTYGVASITPRYVGRTQGGVGLAWVGGDRRQHADRPKFCVRGLGGPPPPPPRGHATARCRASHDDATTPPRLTTHQPLPPRIIYVNAGCGLGGLGLAVLVKHFHQRGCFTTRNFHNGENPTGLRNTRA